MLEKLVELFEREAAQMHRTLSQLNLNKIRQESVGDPSDYYTAAVELIALLSKELKR